MAGNFRMLSNPIPWPRSNRCAVALTWDVDAESGLNYLHQEASDNLVATQSLLQYGPSIAIPRLMEVLRVLELEQTFFVPGWVIERYPEAIDLILEGGHEIALHGYLHERSTQLTQEEELKVLERSLEAYISKVGSRPRGWRAPGFAFSKNSLDLLIDADFDYDSSLMGDDVPYVIQGKNGQLIEFSIDWTSDDWPHYMHNRDFNFMMPISSPDNAMNVFRAEFNAAWNYGALWISVWHPFLSGRLARLHAIIELVEYMRQRGEVWLARLDQIYDHVDSLIDTGRWNPRIASLPNYRGSSSD